MVKLHMRKTEIKLTSLIYKNLFIKIQQKILTIKHTKYRQTTLTEQSTINR